MLIMAAAGSIDFIGWWSHDAQTKKKKRAAAGRAGGDGAAHPLGRLGQGVPCREVSAKHSGGRDSEERLAFRPSSDG
jgi:hypothetical protein